MPAAITELSGDGVGGPGHLQVVFGQDAEKK
jgi:hypothetical protein